MDEKTKVLARYEGYELRRYDDFKWQIAKRTYGCNEPVVVIESPALSGLEEAINPASPAFEMVRRFKASRR